MDEIDENTFMDINKIELTNPETTTTDSSKSSTDSAMVLSDTTREGSWDSTRDSSDTTLNSIPRTFCSHLDDKQGKCKKGRRKTESEKVAKSSDKDSEKETSIQREISCDSVLGESKTKLNPEDTTVVEDKNNSRKSDPVQRDDKKKEANAEDVNDSGGEKDTNLVNSQTPCLKTAQTNVKEKPDLIVPDSQSEKHEQRLKTRQLSTDKKDRQLKNAKMKENNANSKREESNGFVQKKSNNSEMDKAKNLKSNQPDLLGECIKIEASKCDNDNNNSNKADVDKNGLNERADKIEEAKAAVEKSCAPQGTAENVQACDNDDDARKSTDETDTNCTEKGSDSSDHENCKACLSGTTGRFVLPPPPRDRRVSARPGMPSIAEDTIPWTKRKDDSCDSAEDVFDSSTTSSTCKASLSGRSTSGSTSSGAMAGVSSSGSGSSGEENGSPSPKSKSSVPRTTSDSGVETSPPASGPDATIASTLEARTLLDAMHKRYYPTMYQHKERSQSESAFTAESCTKSRCSSQEPPKASGAATDLQVSHSKSATFPSQHSAMLRTTSNSHCRIIALDRLSDSAIQAKIDAMLTHPSQKQTTRVQKEDITSCLGLMSPKLKPKSKSDQGSSATHHSVSSKPLSVLKSFSFTGITSPRPKHKSLKKTNPAPRSANVLASLSPTFRRKKQQPQPQQEARRTAAGETDEEDEDMQTGPCQACVFIQVSQPHMPHGWLCFSLTSVHLFTAEPNFTFSFVRHSSVMSLNWHVL